MNKNRLSFVLLMMALCPIALAQGTSTQATIVRDGYGVPHVYGTSRDAAWFAVGYAQAQDDVERVRGNLHRAAGRLAENGLGGDVGRAVKADLFTHQLHIPQAALAYYEAAEGSPARAFVDAYTRGVNAYIAEHSSTLPSWVTPVAPWEVVASLNFGAIFEQWNTVKNKIEGTLPSSEGSNAFAVGASRSITGRPLVGGQPQTAFSGPDGPRWEFHVSYPGVNAMGASSFGEPGILVGGNEYVAWAGTNNLAHFAAADAYWVPIDNAGHPGAYLFEGTWLPFATETYQINGAPQTALFTRHGPVMFSDEACPNGSGFDRCAYAGRLSYFKDMARTAFSLALLEATSIAGVEEALRTWLPRTNFVAADADGNLLYVYSVKAGIRPDGPYDWSRPVDGSTGASDWLGIVPFDGLPRIENPPGDLLANANDSPWGTVPGLLNPNDFPNWLVWLDGQTERGDHLRDLLDGGPFNIAAFEDIATNAFIPHASIMIPLLGPAWRQERRGYSAREQALGDAALADLESWNWVASLDATAMTIYTAWTIVMAQTNQEVSFDLTNPSVSETDRQKMANSLRMAVNLLQANAGTISIPWGDVHQVDREGRRAPASGGWNRLITSRPKVRAGSVFEGHIDGISGNVLEVRSGSSYVFVTALGQGGAFRSAHPWGNSPDPSSPHYFDQATMWGAGQLKDTMRHDRGAVEAAAESIIDCDLAVDQCTPRRLEPIFADGFESAAPAA